MKIHTKICGITRSEDALKAAALGVDALGFVFFAGSKRAITPEAAKPIIQQLPPFVSAVGLFVNETAENIQKILQTVPLDILQFHGDESPEFCRQFHRPYLKAVRVRSEADVLDALEKYDDARAVLFDAYVVGEYGGTGHAFDWTMLPDDLGARWILSGGLNVDNLAAALAQTGAVAVDVSSGVEQSAGVKSPELMAKFLSICQSKT
ncbi:phosphoribosylanthranilate isomerase [Alysiella crassa]|uniref:N-(5'-phosphoribosyl)anthranilate isomerase n=1 Tax=Alysiella crassa TaxID=153491 RepID=A0A376BTC9_9NEIS|nr:phosphoribosylanthranilate isomerase [Alysiella crassa]SSY80237.1 N-(5'-phosphoribosyl)anthranilate isomerase [Alysiella crassa]